MFLLERILERLSKSEYKNNFILKGGLLISSMIGITERTTMDMDTTVTGINMDEKQIEKVIREILMTEVNDGIKFEFEKLEPICEDDDYNNRSMKQLLEEILEHLELEIFMICICSSMCIKRPLVMRYLSLPYPEQQREETLYRRCQSG